MIDQPLTQLLFLLGAAVVVMMTFLFLRIPTSLGYLLVGVILGPYTIGPTLDSDQISLLAEYGIVFLLFTVGLSYSIPQIHALRNQVLGLGTAQVVLTTVVVGFLAWLAGLPVAGAFVVGAVFAQSSTTVISRQLLDQKEEGTRHGRLGTALSVFQDVTSVPFVVIFPVLGVAAASASLGESLALASAKAVLALVLVFVSGRWLLRPFFHAVAERRSPELFTLTVFLVALAAAWMTSSLGLSMAFGAFLVGMMLGETEFRHQMESVVRPFRDILLGLFFVGIGMLFNPALLFDIWAWALLGTAVLLVSKILLVAAALRWSGHDSQMAWRTALVLAVGGEFGFALLAIAMNAGTIDNHNGQIVLMSVLFSIIAAPFLIRYNGPIARWLSGKKGGAAAQNTSTIPDVSMPTLENHVIVCGYGRIGQSVGRFLEEEKIPFIALDLDLRRVNEARLAGEPVFYGDAASHDMLETVGIDRARLVVISHDDAENAHRMLLLIRSMNPYMHVMVRTRDESQVELLRAAGATEVVPETIESGLMMASHVLLLLDIPQEQVIKRMQEERAERYPLLHAYFKGMPKEVNANSTTTDERHPVSVPVGCSVIGLSVDQIVFPGVLVTALVRGGHKMAEPIASVVIQADDVLVLDGSPAAVSAAEHTMNGAP
jgi:CPA2 family monovalent cation:H+ antiporter-2